MELNDRKLGAAPISHVWIWAVVFTLLFKLWNVAVERMQNKVCIGPPPRQRSCLCCCPHMVLRFMLKSCS
jgi:hypothetical protein